MEKKTKAGCAICGAEIGELEVCGRSWQTLIRAYLESRILTQVQLAEMLDTHVSNVNRWVQGKSKPSAEYRMALMDLFQGKKHPLSDLWKMAVERSPTVQILLDDRYCVLMASKAYLTLLRLDASELIGQSYERFVTESIEQNFKGIGGPKRWFSEGVLCMESYNLRKAGENAKNRVDLAFKTTCSTVSDGSAGRCLRLVNSVPIDARGFTFRRPEIQRLDDREV